ncbi:MAG: uracil-DNA glycosylase [Rubrobacter sp.]
MEFSEAQKEALSCTRCALWHSRSQVIFGEGPLNASLFIVGESPGFNEDSEGRTFRGASGLLLERLLDSIGLSREKVYTTTLVKCLPPGSPPRHPKPAELSSCRGYLMSQLSAVDPKIVLALGETASRLLTGKKDPLRKLRGRMVPLDGRYVLPTFSLRDALYVPADRALLISDFSRLPDLLDSERPATYGTHNVISAPDATREPVQPGLF